MFEQDLKRYDEIQRLNTRTPDPIPNDDPRWREVAYGWIYTVLLMIVCVFVFAMFAIGLVHTARFVFSYSVPVISADTEQLHEQAGRLR